uniref:Transthyretin-like family-containing protein n=1 Tax=Strongyloides stercoralis TaxID=6248 RepID=A0A0K0ERZ3_STRER
MDYRIAIFLLTFCAFLTFAFPFGKKQKIIIIVKGHITCEGIPLDKILVKLVNYRKHRRDITLDTVKTRPNGSFYLKGKVKKTAKLNPKLKIWHKCSTSKTVLKTKLCYLKYSPKTPEIKKIMEYPKTVYTVDYKDVKLKKDKNYGEKDCLRFFQKFINN